MVDTKKSTIKSIETGFAILKVCEEHGSLTLNELSKLTGLHKSQLYRYLNTFVNLGVMTRHENYNNPTWSLGPELITLGEAAFTSFDLAKEAKSELIKLKNTLNETVALSIWREQGAFFIRWEKSNKTVNIGLDTGSYIPLYSASGKIFRAFLPEEITDPLYEKEIKNGELDLEAYEASIKRVKEEHLSFSESSFIEGISAVSAPIFYPSGDLAGAMSVIGLTGSLDTSVDSKNVQELQKTVQNISRKLGYNQ